MITASISNPRSHLLDFIFSNPNLSHLYGTAESYALPSQTPWCLAAYQGMGDWVMGTIIGDYIGITREQKTVLGSAKTRGQLTKRYLFSPVYFLNLYLSVDSCVRESGRD